MQDIDKINQIQDLILLGKIEEADHYCTQCAEKDVNDKELMICYLLFRIREQEIHNNEACIFDLSEDLSILRQHYHNIKFLVRRLEFDWLQVDSAELVRYCMENKVSLSALFFVIQCSTRNPRQITEKMKRLFAEYNKNV